VRQPVLIARSNRQIERLISAHKRAFRKLRNKRTPESIKLERTAFAELMRYKPDQIDCWSLLNYTRYMRGQLIRRA
jgi:hypothetical protein